MTSTDDTERESLTARIHGGNTLVHYVATGEPK